MTLAIPVLASAQPYPGQQYDRGDRSYDRDRRDSDRDNRNRGGVYPQFRDMEAHIRRAIEEGVREDLIERDDARDLMRQLQNIQRRETREYRAHGWNLPADDRQQINDGLRDLDRRVDEIRAEG